MDGLSQARIPLSLIHNGNQGSSSIMFDAKVKDQFQKRHNSAHLNISTDKRDYRSGDIISVNTTLQNYSIYNNSAIWIIVSPGPLKYYLHL